MKAIKVILAILLALLTIWVGLWVVGLLSTIVYLAFILAILYLVGMLIWKVYSLANSKEHPKENYQLNSESKTNEERLSDASRKLEEMKRQLRQK